MERYSEYTGGFFLLGHQVDSVYLVKVGRVEAGATSAGPKSRARLQRKTFIAGVYTII